MEFRYMFKINKDTIFAVDNRTIGDNDFSYYKTSVYELNKNRDNFKIAGQAQEDLLEPGSMAQQFYNKYKDLEFSTLNDSVIEKMMADIDILKKEYSFDELITESTFKGTEYSTAMIDIESAAELLNEGLSLDEKLAAAEQKTLGQTEVSFSNDLEY